MKKKQSPPPLECVSVFGTVETTCDFTESIEKRSLSGPHRIPLLIEHDMHKLAGDIKHLAMVGNQLVVSAVLFLSISYVRSFWDTAKSDGYFFDVGYLASVPEEELPASLVEVSVLLKGSQLVTAG
jgi:hypothetical protein